MGTDGCVDVWWLLLLSVLGLPSSLIVTSLALSVFDDVANVRALACLLCCREDVVALGGRGSHGGTRVAIVVIDLLLIAVL